MVMVAMAVFLPAAAPAAAQEGDLVTVSVEVSAEAEGGDYARAHQNAIARAFASAVYAAAAGVIPPGEMAGHEDMLRARILSRAADFVMSYKILEETVDTSHGVVAARMQVTLFMDSLRRELAAGGARAAPRAAVPRLALIVREAGGLAAQGNFLVFPSRGEEALGRALRQRGYPVAGREEARQAKLEQQVAAAMGGDVKAAAAVAEALGAQALALGEARVEAQAAPGGEKVKATITVALRDARGRALLTLSAEDEGVYQGVLQGSVAALRGAADKLAQDVADAVAARPEFRQGG